MLIKKFKFFIVVSMLIYFKISYGIVVEEFYTPHVEVGSKDLSDAQKIIIIQEEFDKILTKLTGKSNITIPNVEQFVSKYEYQGLIVNESNKFVFKMYFEKNLIQSKLNEIKQPFLNENRPVTIIWPKADSPILSHQIQNLLNKISLLAKNLTLPIILPVLDLKEVAILNKEHQDNNFVNLIKTASKRYNVDEVIIADCSNNQDTLKISWRSLINDWNLKNHVIKNYEDINNNELELHAKLFIDKLMQHFINIYMGDQQNLKQVVLLRISNINNLEDFANVEKYLQNLAIVNNLNVTKFSFNEVEFQIIANGGKQAIKNILATTNKLLTENRYDNLDNNLLSYTLNL